MNTVELLQRLIDYPTVSRDSNLALIEFAANWLEDAGARVELVHNADRSKANLHAVIGPEDIPGVVLSGHSDVVPVEGQPWTVDPFRSTVRDGRVYGRGSADMKGYLAAVLALAPDAAPKRLGKPLHVVFSHDEEIGCVGVRSLIERMKTWEVMPESCVIGEPTDMRPAIAHKGKTAARCECRGVAAHSSLPDLGVNAIHLAVDMITEVRRLQRHLIESGARDGDFNVPYTTLHVGTIEGGTILNTVPDACRFELEIRNLPGDDPDALMTRLDEAAQDIASTYRSRFAEAGIELKVVNQYPALDTEAGSEAVSWVKALCGESSHDKLAFGTEGGLFHRELGIPTVICGPGSMNQGHKPDEYVEVSQLEACDRFLTRMLNDLVDS